MKDLSTKVVESYRTGNKPVSNPNNPVTRKRRKLYEKIKGNSHGNIGDELLMSLNILKDNRPLIEQYILSRNEQPLENIEDLAKQAYELRCKEIDDAAQFLQVNEGEAAIFLEDEEALTNNFNSFQGGEKLGELFAPIGIAAAHLYTGENESDNFIDGGLVSGLLNTAGTKIDAGALKRAAQNKPSGVLGFLSGGKKEYEMLRAYLQDPANVQEKNAVLAGTITNANQLKGFQPATNDAGLLGTGGLAVAANDVINEIAKQKKREMIRKNLPFIIIGVVAIILITVLIVKNAKRN